MSQQHGRSSTVTRSEDLLGGAVLTCGFLPLIAAVAAVVAADDVGLGWLLVAATGPLLPFSFGSLITQDGRDEVTAGRRGLGRVHAILVGMWSHPNSRTRMVHRASVIGTVAAAAFMTVATI